MPKDHNQYVTVEDFINTYLEAEDILRNKIDNSRAYLEDYYR